LRAGASFVVADVQGLQGIGERGDDVRVPVAEVVDPAVEVDVDELPTVDVPDPVASRRPMTRSIPASTITRTRSGQT
jgi:hypothetical protein